MEIAVEAEGLRRSQYATAIIFPSVECADEKHLTFFACDTEEMVLTRPPVWKSQLVRSNSSLNPVNRQPSGEKLSHWVFLDGEVKVLILPRVFASRISIFVEEHWANAMNLLHGDHVTALTLPQKYLVEIVSSHEVGTPCTTFTKGRLYGLYRLCTVDVVGDKRSAE